MAGVAVAGKPAIEQRPSNYWFLVLNARQSAEDSRGNELVAAGFSMKLVFHVISDIFLKLLENFRHLYPAFPKHSWPHQKF